METLNDLRPVTKAEVAHVQAMLLDLGASEHQMTVEQLRGALAAWYLHVPREPTEWPQVYSEVHRVLFHRVINGVVALARDFSQALGFTCRDGGVEKLFSEGPR